MKILIVTDAYKPMINGVVTSIINLQDGLLDLGHDVRILTLSENSKSYRDGNIYYIGSCDMSDFYPNAKMKVRSGKSEVADILMWKPDIIHTQSEFSIFSLATKIAKELSIPVIHNYHTMYEDYTHYFSPNKTIGKKTVTAITNSLAKKVEAMIAPTNKIYHVLDEYGVTCPVEVIPSGICLEKFEVNVSEEEIKEMKNNLNIPEENMVLLSVSRIGKEKNIGELVYYMSLLKERKISLVIVGDGPDREAMEKLVNRCQLEEYIKFTGMVPPQEIPKYYKMADLFVSASTSETQGLTYIEAMASGTPILCKKDACLDGVLCEGVNGYSFTNKKEFIEKFNCFINQQDKNNMSIEAKKTSLLYSKTRFVDSIVALYEKQIMLNKKSEYDIAPSISA